MGSVALRYDLPVFKWVSLLQPGIFYDGGYVALNNAPSGFASNASGQSAGAGVLIQLLKNWQMGLTLAKPLRITNTSNVDMGWQGFFNITGVFQ